MADEWDQFPDAGANDSFADFPDAPANKSFIPSAPKKYGDEESIYFQSTGETLKAPMGTGKVLNEAINNSVFDNSDTIPEYLRPKNYRLPDDPVYGTDTTSPSSTTMEETSAMLEAQAAWLTLIAASYGLVDDDNVADFVADRSKALRSAQERAPEYMKEFYRQFSESKGFFEGAAVMMSNTAALGRAALTQSPNSIIPLASTLAGANIGSRTGAILGFSAAPVPGGTAIGTGVGATVGGVAGAFTGTAIVEIGSQLDEMIQEAGFDITDANSVRQALGNKDLMEMIKAKAERKGITTATVDALFQVVGGKFIKSLEKGAKAAQKAGAVVADVGVQSAGEFTGEAAGQYARDGRIDWKDAALEMVSSITTSTGQTAIGASYGGVRTLTGSKVTDSVVFKPTLPITAPEPQAEIDTPISLVPQEESAAIVKDFLEGREVNISAYDDAQQKAITDVLERAKPVREKVVRGRIKKLDTDIEIKLNELDVAETEIEIAKSEGRSTKRLEKRAEKLANEWMAMDEERGGLLTIEDINTETADTLNKDITVKGDALVKLEERVTKESIKATNKAFREARVAAKKDVKAVQKDLSAAIRQSGLSKKDQAGFINDIVNMQTEEQLQKQAPKIQQKIETKLNNAYRKDTLSKIKKILAGSKNSNVIAVDFINKIQALVDPIDLKSRNQDTMDSLMKTLDYLDKNPDAKIPKSLAKKLGILTKLSIDEVPTADLEAIYTEMKSLIDLGKTKLKLMKMRKKRIQERRLRELAVDTKKLSNIDMKRAPLGERLSAVDKVKNTFKGAMNSARRLNVNKNQMDVIFDIVDNFKEYKGANHRIFKQTIDRGFGRYLNLKEKITREVKDLADRLNLTDEQYQRIGAYAAMQQDGGRSKLIETGFSPAEIDNLTLTDTEQQMYDLMRAKLDEMLPLLKEIMRVNYNKNLTEVTNYFPFLTDFEKTSDLAIQDRIGDPPLIGKKKNVDKKFTIDRNGGKQNIRIDAMNIFLSHVDNAAYLIEMGADIKDLADISTSQEYEDMAGDFGSQIVTDWLDLLARKGGNNARVKGLDVLRKNTGFAVLGYKLSTTLVQATALGDGAALIGGDWVGKGIAATAYSDQWRQFLYDNMPEVRERAGDDPNYLNMGGDGIVGNVREMGFWALKKVDLMVASAVAAGAYMRYMKENNLEVDFTNPNEDALQYAQLLMRRTQSSAFAKDQAPIMSQGKLTGTVSLDKLILQFQSFMFNRWSVIQHDMIEGGLLRGKTVKAANIAVFLVLANFADTEIRALSETMWNAVFGIDDDDKDEEEENAIMDKALAQVPFVSSAVKSFDYGSTPVPALSLLQKIATEAKYASMSKDEDKFWRHVIKGTTTAAGIGLGVPGMVQIDALAGALMDDGPTKAKSRY